MDYSRKISERLWNRPEKGELESRREEILILAQKKYNDFIRQYMKYAKDGGIFNV